MIGFHRVTVLHQGRADEIECRWGTVDATLALEADGCMLEALSHSFVYASIDGRSGTLHPCVDRLPKLERVIHLFTVLPPPALVRLPARCVKGQAVNYSLHNWYLNEPLRLKTP